MPRNPNCTLCKLHDDAQEVCTWGFGSRNADVMVVGRSPNSEKYQQSLELELSELGLDLSRVYFTQALKCLNFEKNSSNSDVKTCKGYLDEEIARLKPKYILTLGNEALLAVAGKSGIMKYRGRFYDRDQATVMPTISPSAVNRNPGQRPGYVAELRQFVNLCNGIDTKVEIPERHIIDTPEKLKKLRKILLHTKLIAYDVETHDEYFEPSGRIVSLAGTCEVETKQGMVIYLFVIPLYHPESPFRKTWRSVMRFLAPVMRRIKKTVAHNGKYDEKWMRQFECPIELTFDTIIAIHLLNENLQKGLKPTAQARLGVEPWGIDTKSLLDKPLAQILEYNMLDTYYDYLLYLQLKAELQEQPRLLRLFKFLMMPANRELVDTEMRAIWLDVNRLKKAKPIVEKELFRIENELKMHLPDPSSDDWPKDKRGRPREINFNASIFARWFLFEWLKLPVLERGKEKPDGSPGDPSMAEDVLGHLRKRHPAVELMLERVKWNKYLTGFINAYEANYDENHRIHTNFKLTGTVTGRLSSGKSDEDKISVARGKRKGINLQQVPRDPLIRGLFGAPPGWTFVEADYSQIELRLAAFLAREMHMLHLYSIGADIHLTTAARVTGLPESQVPKEVRKRVGKPVNFGFLYGMSWRKFIETAFNNYGAVFTEQEAQDARKLYFDMFPMLLQWHARQRRLVNNHGRVQSPLGRIRHLPDIYSPSQGVRAEAERQAINSPPQGMASDMAVFSMININQKFREMGLAANCLGLVHDAINYEIRNDHVAQALPVIKETMEDVSLLRKKFGVNLDVPIVADLQTGQHWGDTLELSVDQVYDWKLEYKGA
jgi:uracil-DNA glycosylase family 4